MKGVPRALGATPWLAATVVVLLPTLAWLQYDWVNQLATADRERRQRTLRAAGAQFTAAVDAEISRLGGGLQLDGAMVERRDWDAYALRYDAALEGGTSGLDPQVWFAEIDEAAATPEARIVLRHWNPSSRAFEPVDWPPALQPLRAQQLHGVSRERPPARRRSAAGVDRSFHETQVVMAKYYAERVLPRCAVHGAAIRAGSSTPMALAAEQF